MTISSFRGENRFLSNFYPFPIISRTGIYPTVEHYFQARKAKYLIDLEAIRGASSPKEARKLGRIIEIRADWELHKEHYMLWALRQKFFPGSKLAERLCDTDEEILIEGNTWHDQIWGDCYCGRPSCQEPGKNLLGKLLMKIREELQKGVV